MEFYLYPPYAYKLRRVGKGVANVLKLFVLFLEYLVTALIHIH